MKVWSRGFVRVMVVIGAITVLAMVLAACGGGGGDDNGGGGGNGIAISEKEYSITPATVTAPAGKITFNIKNEGTIQHDLGVKGDGIDESHSDLIDPGKSLTWSVTIDKPGTYTLFCSVPGHEEQGMKATLTVQ